MATTEYDPRCEELARAFLADPPPGESGEYTPDEDTVAELAGTIQRAIDDWNAGKEKTDAADN